MYIGQTSHIGSFISLPFSSLGVSTWMHEIVVYFGVSLVVYHQKRGSKLGLVLHENFYRKLIPISFKEPQILSPLNFCLKICTFRWGVLFLIYLGSSSLRCGSSKNNVTCFKSWISTYMLKSKFDDFEAKYEMFLIVLFTFSVNIEWVTKLTNFCLWPSLATYSYCFEYEIKVS